METIAKRAKHPMLSNVGEQVLVQYERRLRVEEDVSSATTRNYLSVLRQFIAWCESLWQQGREDTRSFTPEVATSPTLTHYRPYLQALQLKPNTINRALISLKRYFAWLMATGQLTYDPAKVVKLVGEEVTAPRHLDDQGEQALVATVTETGNARDRAIILLMLHNRGLAGNRDAPTGTFPKHPHRREAHRPNVLLHQLWRLSRHPPEDPPTDSEEKDRQEQECFEGFCHVLHLGCPDLVMNLAEGLAIGCSDGMGNGCLLAIQVMLNLGVHVHIVKEDELLAAFAIGLYSFVLIDGFCQAGNEERCEAGEPPKSTEVVTTPRECDILSLTICPR